MAFTPKPGSHGGGADPSQFRSKKTEPPETDFRLKGCPKDQEPDISLLPPSNFRAMTGDGLRPPTNFRASLTSLLPPRNFTATLAFLLAPTNFNADVIYLNPPVLSADLVSLSPPENFRADQVALLPPDNFRAQRVGLPPPENFEAAYIHLLPPDEFEADLVRLSAPDNFMAAQEGEEEGGVDVLRSESEPLTLPRLEPSVFADVIGSKSEPLTLPPLRPRVIADVLGSRATALRLPPVTPRVFADVLGSKSTALALPGLSPRVHADVLGSRATVLALPGLSPRVHADVLGSRSTVLALPGLSPRVFADVLGSKSTVLALPGLSPRVHADVLGSKSTALALPGLSPRVHADVLGSRSTVLALPGLSPRVFADVLGSRSTVLALPGLSPRVFADVLGSRSTVLALPGLSPRVFADVLGSRSTVLALPGLSPRVHADVLGSRSTVLALPGLSPRVHADVLGSRSTVLALPGLSPRVHADVLGSRATVLALPGLSPRVHADVLGSKSTALALPGLSPRVHADVLGSKSTALALPGLSPRVHADVLGSRSTVLALPGLSPRVHADVLGSRSTVLALPGLSPRVFADVLGSRSTVLALPGLSPRVFADVLGSRSTVLALPGLSPRVFADVLGSRSTVLALPGLSPRVHADVLGSKSTALALPGLSPRVHADVLGSRSTVLALPGLSPRVHADVLGSKSTALALPGLSPRVHADVLGSKSTVLALPGLSPRVFADVLGSRSTVLALPGLSPRVHADVLGSKSTALTLDRVVPRHVTRNFSVAAASAFAAPTKTDSTRCSAIGAPSQELAFPSIGYFAFQWTRGFNVSGDITADRSQGRVTRFELLALPAGNVIVSLAGDALSPEWGIKPVALLLTADTLKLSLPGPWSPGLPSADQDRASPYTWTPDAAKRIEALAFMSAFRSLSAAKKATAQLCFSVPVTLPSKEVQRSLSIESASVFSRRAAQRAKLPKSIVRRLSVAADSDFSRDSEDTAKLPKSIVRRLSVAADSDFSRDSEDSDSGEPCANLDLGTPSGRESGSVFDNTHWTRAAGSKIKLPSGAGAVGNRFFRQFIFGISSSMGNPMFLTLDFDTGQQVRDRADVADTFETRNDAMVLSAGNLSLTLPGPAHNDWDVLSSDADAYQCRASASSALGRRIKAFYDAYWNLSAAARGTTSLKVCWGDTCTATAAPAVPAIARTPARTSIRATPSSATTGVNAADKYEVQYRAGTTGSADGTVTRSPWMFSGLDCGTVYQVRARAGNCLAWSSWSSWFTVSTTVCLPGLPTYTLSRTLTTITVVPTATDATRYTVDLRPSGGGAVLKTVSTSPYTFTGLTAGTIYRLTITAFNTAGSTAGAEIWTTTLFPSNLCTRAAPMLTLAGDMSTGVEGGSDSVGVMATAGAVITVATTNSAVATAADDSTNKEIDITFVGEGTATLTVTATLAATAVCPVQTATGTIAVTVVKGTPPPPPKDCSVAVAIAGGNVLVTEGAASQARTFTVTWGADVDSSGRTVSPTSGPGLGTPTISGSTLTIPIPANVTSTLTSWVRITATGTCDGRSVSHTKQIIVTVRDAADPCAGVTVSIDANDTTIPEDETSTKIPVTYAPSGYTWSIKSQTGSNLITVAKGTGTDADNLVVTTSDGPMSKATKDVTLEVTGACGTNTVTVTITKEAVVPPPPADLAVSVTPHECRGQPGRFGHGAGVIQPCGHVLFGVVRRHQCGDREHQCKHGGHDHHVCRCGFCNDHRDGHGGRRFGHGNRGGLGGGWHSAGDFHARCHASRLGCWRGYVRRAGHRRHALHGHIDRVVRRYRCGLGLSHGSGSG